MTTRRTCIGVFDSGFGGLTVLKALLRLIPNADYLYFGDTARLPYGSKSAETVARYAVGAARYLEQHGAQALVIACNTATALALDRITQAATVPVIGVIEPGTERAAAESGNKRVVVIGTEATVSSHAYLKALQARGVQAKEKACPLLVPLVEEGCGSAARYRRRQKQFRRRGRGLEAFVVHSRRRLRSEFDRPQVEADGSVAIDACSDRPHRCGRH